MSPARHRLALVVGGLVALSTVLGAAGAAWRRHAGRERALAADRLTISGGGLTPLPDSELFAITTPARSGGP